ncbi:glycoside hydrolase family 3 C-terminal domain-containing protein [Plantibacter sp. VKM Ac-2885]|uniref:glycoside hydrolase family 3 C-terminal domain-containing protein n=1 Tax=Plantibacter sp. VKM Ac-2885 TaxID=2783828 RepID=UPI00188A321F|nr:glycoside hydrolase family 3 C-terminal domain-containing protein [Plantibacter sp. VKM Ac-2885]MBF4514178.1 glycoside hydrolase family 3 C-terminal domain-containing protein [Plantibacter sp. VKM Ac-2885]
MTDSTLPPATYPQVTSLPADRKAQLLSGQNFWETEPIPEIGAPAVKLADGTYGLRHQSGRHDHLAMFESDPATCFPPGVAVGSSWNPDVAARLGAALGKEAVAQGVHIVLGPGINIKRSPLCGRNFEYYSEDPFLTGTLGTAFTRALQAEGPGVSVKHFAANNQETNRQTISSDVDERTLREIYLPAFEQVVTEASPATVMASYNKINGVFASENPWLLTDLLRAEWGFRGAVISDWNAVTDRVAALRAGMDLEMPGGTAAHDDDVRQALADGALSSSDLDASVQRVAALVKHIPVARPEVDYDRQHTVARELAAECAVLLRNEHDVLPIPGNVRLAVIGEFAETLRYQGGGSAHVNATRVDQPIDAIRDLALENGVSVAYARGFTIDGGADDPAQLANALDIARRSDIAVIFAGLGEAVESEGIDRPNIDLPETQVALIKAVAAVAQRTVVVLANGGVVSLEGWHDDVDAILEGFLLGQGGGHAIADILFGRVNPSGRLAETIPRRLNEHPSSLNFPGEQGHVRYGEGVMVGYRYFATFEAPVRYPFGHGLTYTRFTTSDLRVELTGDDTAQVHIDVTNSGDRFGQHVVQVYVSTDAGPVKRPIRELRGFAKVGLEPGETTTVQIELPRRAFAYWDIRHSGWVVAAGDYRIQVAQDSHTVLDEVAVSLAGDRIVTELTMDTPMGEWFDHPQVGQRVKDTLGFSAVEVSPEHMAMMASMTMTQFVNISGLDIPADALAALIEASRPA